jgi:uncharacterized repeat protein (TIGR03803 family)
MRFLQQLGARGRFLSLAVLMTGLSATAGAQTETVRYSFTGVNNTENPVALVPDGHGNYFGVGQGQSSNGTVFELSPASGDWTLTTLYTFLGGADGQSPNSLVIDSAGNLYGETSYGGHTSLLCKLGCGTIFELTSNGEGGWTKSTIYTFRGNASQVKISDGSNPSGGLTLDNAGNLYGTTLWGGGGKTCSYTDVGCGAVFELSPSASGAWTEKLIHRFDGATGANPLGGVIFDSTGNLYGTTSEGGASNSSCDYGCGTIFELSPSSAGGWSSTVLQTFNGSNGFSPSSGLVMDSKGNLYGTTVFGGPSDNGVVFAVEHSGSKWKLITLFEFDNTDGSSPDTSLTFDSHGNLYGATPAGGATCSVSGTCGVIFKLSLSSGKWQESTYYSFQGEPDGAVPQGPIIFDSHDNAFGITTLGGTANLGTFYEITP